MKASPDLFDRSNPGTDQVVGRTDRLAGKCDHLAGCQDELRRLFRALWPKKTAQYLALAADITVREAERVLAGDRGLSLASFRLLIRSEHGFPIMHILIGDAQPAWWRELCHERRLAMLRRERRSVEKQLKELEGA